ncbi:hypothetical protein MNAN1_000600 [Malassezia nana]|uniref:RNI-like protein n=1 Tax=Malassezia nana TaxID=180528 RepID=A0AAF0EP53_9BASI|nr:hypothetical protein MNAN1_000600 [Malassezia nana]
MAPVPAEIVQRICEIVYLDSVPLCSLRLLDPSVVPSAAFDGQSVLSLIDDTQQVLFQLCLVSRLFYRYAHPLLCRRVQITLPYRFMLLLQLAQGPAPPASLGASTLGSIRLLDFSAFRAMGLRRTVGESTERRFVTPERLITLIRSATGLVAFGSSPTMDSALSLEVLEALLIRDGESSRPKRLRDVSMDRGAHVVHNALQSLDLCGCVSPRFLEAMHSFVRKYLDPAIPQYDMYDVLEEDETALSNSTSESSDDERRGRSRQWTRGPRAPSPPHHQSHGHRRTFPSLQRLGLTGVSLERSTLASFVLSFPNLTHLDLSQTRVDAAMLYSLGQSNVRLESLSLSRCRALTSDSLVYLLVRSPTTAGLQELSLQGTILFPTPVSPDDMLTILTSASCLQRGALRYLDLGGCPITDEALDVMAPQHALLDLGLSAIPALSLQSLCAFLQRAAPNVQVLDLTHSATASGTMHAVRLYHELLGPCTQPPTAVSIAEQLAKLGIRKDCTPSPWQPPSNLRVVGLSQAVLATVRGGVGSWKTIWGAGRRGWVVDTAAGPHPEAYDIPEPDTEDDVRGRSRLARAVQRSTSVGTSGRSRDALAERPLARGVSPRPPPAAFESRSRSLSLSREHQSCAVKPPARREGPARVERQTIRDLPEDHPRRLMLEHLGRLDGTSC